MRKHSVSFPDSLWEQLEAEASRQGRTVGQLVREGARGRLRYADAERDPEKREQVERVKRTLNSLWE